MRIMLLLENWNIRTTSTIIRELMVPLVPSTEDIQTHISKFVE